MPLLFTAGGVQREQTLVSCTQIKRIADFNRGHFVGDFARIVGLFQIAGAEDPRFFQLVNVIRSDLFQRRIALAFLITSIGRPVFVGDRRACCDGRGVGAKRTVDLLRVVEASRVRMPPLISSATTSAATAPLEGTTSRCQTNGNISQMPKNTRISLRGVSAQKSNPTSHTPKSLSPAAGRHTAQRGTFTAP